MNSIFRLKLRAVSCAVALALGLGALSIPPPARAQWIVFDPGHTWQTILAEIARLEDAWRQHKQLQDMLKNVQDINGLKSLFVPMEQQQITRDLVNLYNKGKSLAHTMQNLDEQFKSQYPGYEKYLEEIKSGNIDDLPKSYAELAKAGEDNARLAMKAAGLNISAFADEDRAMDILLKASASAKGQVQAMHISNEIAAQQMKQTQMMRQMLATQINLQSNWMAQQNKMEAQGNAQRQKTHIDTPVNNSSAKTYQAALKEWMDNDNRGNPTGW